MLWEKIKAHIGLSKITAGVTSVMDPFGIPVSEAKDKQLREELHTYRRNIHEILADKVLIAPSLPRNHYFHHELVISQVDWFQTAIFNGLAVPVAIAPLGLDEEGYPKSVQIVSAPGNDYLLLRIQQHLSEKFGGWRPPKV